MSKFQEAGSISRVGLALSKWPHFDSVYLLRGRFVLLSIVEGPTWIDRQKCSLKHWFRYLYHNTLSISLFCKGIFQVCMYKVWQGNFPVSFPERWEKNYGAGGQWMGKINSICYVCVLLFSGLSIVTSSVRKLLQKVFIPRITIYNLLFCTQFWNFSIIINEIRLSLLGLKEW